MKEHFLNLWHHVYASLSPQKREKQLASQFAATRGKNYDQNKVKLLLVGQAPNGWNLGSLNHLSPDRITEEMVQEMANEAEARLYHRPECGSWVEKRENGLYADDGKYSLNRSPFWRTAEKIEKGLWKKAERAEEQNAVWLENIAWSNLYKLSPAAGNPSEKSKTLQNEICREILKEEVRALQPTHIVMMTGWEGWAKNFQDCFDVLHVTGQKNVSRGDNKNEIYVEATGRMGNSKAKVVVLCRPEGRKDESYVEAALKAFDNFQ